MYICIYVYMYICIYVYMYRIVYITYIFADSSYKTDINFVDLVEIYYSKLVKIHIPKSFKANNSAQIGILECCLPQISEHCPYKTPGRSLIKLTWFTRPGIASAFTPKEGIVQE